jgi:hypothetical protein
LRWKRQLGTSDFDRSNGVATDGNGNVYISGYSSGSDNAWVAKYSAAGKLLWKRELGKLSEFEHHESNGVATDGKGNVYISGEAHPVEPGEISIL